MKLFSPHNQHAILTAPHEVQAVLFSGKNNAAELIAPNVQHAVLTAPNIHSVVLGSPLVQKATLIGEYIEPSPPGFIWSNMEIIVAQSTVRFVYDTSESADCKFYHRIPGDFWIPLNNWTSPHGTSHDHIWSGYTPGTVRHFKIWIRNADLEIIYAPSATTHYKITFGTGGEEGTFEEEGD